MRVTGRIPIRSAAALLVFATLYADAYWIVQHKILTHDRLDPIVSPGKVGSHVHTVVGASNFGPTVSFESLQASNCTTAPIQKDKRRVFSKNSQTNDALIRLALCSVAIGHPNCTMLTRKAIIRLYLTFS